MFLFYTYERFALRLCWPNLPPHILFPLRLWVKWLFISSFLFTARWKLSIVLHKFHYLDSFFCSLTFQTQMWKQCWDYITNWLHSFLIQEKQIQNLHDHGGILHDPAAGSELLDGTGCVQRSRPPVGSMDQIPKKKKTKQNRRRRQINKQVSHTYLIFCFGVVHISIRGFMVSRSVRTDCAIEKKKTTIKTIAENLLSLKMPVVATLECTRERNPSRYETNSKQSAQR